MRTRAGTAFALSFVGLGAAGVAAAIPAMVGLGALPGSMILLFGAVFATVGVMLLKASRPFTFDCSSGRYYRGKLDEPGRTASYDERGLLARIHAVQLLSERVRSSRGSSSSQSYTSHELNLVLDDARRVNVMDHGGDVEAAAEQLARFLGVPLWKGSSH